MREEGKDWVPSATIPATTLVLVTLISRKRAHVRWSHVQQCEGLFFVRYHNHIKSARIAKLRMHLQKTKIKIEKEKREKRKEKKE